MAHIFDYLDWRGDMPLFVDPFNEVDSLILSMLAYTDFRDIVPGDGTEVPLRDAYRAFFSRHTREEVLAGKAATATEPQVCLDCGYVIQAATNHTHELNHVEAKEPGFVPVFFVFQLAESSHFFVLPGLDNRFTISHSPSVFGSLSAF